MRVDDSSQYLISYVACATGTTTLCGANDAKGDLIQRISINITTAGAGGVVSLKDGTTTIPVAAANTPIGLYYVELGAQSVTGGWSVVCGNAATAIAVGRFSPNAG